MKTIEQSWNCQDVKDVLRKDNSYKNIAYDGSPDIDNYIPDFKNSVWFILKEDDNISGFIKLDYISNVMWNSHICVYEKYRGKGSEEWGIQVVQEMALRYGAKKFLAITPYTTAKKYAERMGFKYIMILTSSIIKNGKTLDQYMLEMNSGEERTCR